MKPLTAIIILVACLFLCLTVQTLYRLEGFSQTPALMPVTFQSAGTQAGFRKVGLGADNSLFALNSNDNLFTFASGNWTQLTSGVDDFAATNANTVVGVTRQFAVYQTVNASSANPVWTKLSGSRFDSISLGWDGSVWATVLPVSGTWGVYSYDGTANWTKYPGSFRTVSARSSNELWALAPDGSLWQSLQGQTWVSISAPSPFTQLSVGSDGTVWALDATNALWHRQPTDGTWQKASGTFVAVSAMDGMQIAVVDTTGRVLTGSVAPAASTTQPVESPFVVNAYSGGSAAYSDAQNSQVGWATLTVNQISLIGRDPSSMQAPSNGLNVAAVDDSGALLSVSVYDTGNDATQSDKLAAGIKSLITTKAKPLAQNLYSAFQETGGLNGGKGPLLPDGSPNMGPNWGINLAGNLVYTGSVSAGAFNAPVVVGAYLLSFDYQGNGQFSMDNTGPDPSILKATVTATSSWQTYTKQFKHTAAGTESLMFQLVGATSVEFANVSLTVDNSAARLPRMVFALVHGDAASALQQSAVSQLNSMGATQFGNLQKGGSYSLVYDCQANAVLDEQLNNMGNVTFISKGKAPVIHASWSGASTGSPLLMVNRGLFISYDTTAAKVITSVDLSKSSLPPPFSSSVDCVIQTPNGRLILFSDSFWLAMSSDMSTVVAGPDVIGQGITSGISSQPFLTGLDAASPMPDGTCVIFKTGSFAILDSGLSSIKSQGTIGASGTPFSGLPSDWSSGLDSAFLAGTVLGLVKSDMLLMYNPTTQTVSASPVSILSDSRFTGLPLSFRVSSIAPSRPFLNQTIFKGNRLRNLDMSVQQGTSGYPGWSPDTFSLYNQGVTANVTDPPIMTQNLIANYPGVVAQYGSTPNALLTAYEKYGQTSGWDVQEYGGNTVTFTIKTPTANSYWMSHDSSGKAYGNCKMMPGEVYDLSLWARTTDVTSMSVGAYTGSPNDAKTQATSLVNMAPISVTSDLGWQLLTWEFRNPSKSLAQDVSFVISQGSTGASLHSLYGPNLSPVATTLSRAEATNIADLTSLVLQSVATSTCLVCSGSQATSGAVGAAGTAMCFLPGATPGLFYIVSMTVSQVSNCLASSSGTPVFSSTADSTCLWIITKDVDGGLYLNNYADDTLLVINTDGSVTLKANPLTMKDMTPGAMRIVPASPAAAATPIATYVQAAYAQDPLLSPALVMFKRGTFTVYDTQHQKTLLYPANIGDHSWFQRLPSAFQPPDACIQNQGTEVFLFRGSSWILWDTALGDYAASFTQRAPQRMGPGGHAFFSQLAPPFCKGIQGGYKLDASTVVIVSGSQSITWDMAAHAAKAAPVPLSTLLPGMPQDVLSGMSTLVEDPLNFGSLFVFSQGLYALYDAVNKKLLQGPAPLGPGGQVFQTLVSPFVPNQAETCQLYNDIIMSNTDYPATACVEDPNNPYPWIKTCMFAQPACGSVSGVYNTAGSFCGSSISAGQTPLLNVDPSIRQQYVNLYLTECQTVSEHDYQSMKAAEAAKYSSATAALTQAKATSNSTAQQIATQQSNLQTLNTQLQALNLQLTTDDQLSCHPNVVCLKQIDTGFGSTTIPTGCNAATIDSIINQPVMTAADVQSILAIATSAKDVVNSYPIQVHPDYPKYVQTSTVEKCAGTTKRKSIADFSLSDFPTFSNYINISQLLPPGGQGSGSLSASTTTSSTLSASTTSNGSLSATSGSLSASSGTTSGVAALPVVSPTSTRVNSATVTPALDVCPTGTVSGTSMRKYMDFIRRALASQQPVCTNGAPAEGA
ncbi:hypothetical protein CVIRNUC_003361 [Coccomyxa viridis]|uniref:Uncharacterized protein n=1 Tax=Coccomyxa viridis TaxID=1274662 RepID=A0AAV1HZX1_9CHLO|nr:hypothetical protein CVIRNUC_003361 [Coccomyxa viridis]